MRTFRDAKLMAKALRSSLEQHGLMLSHANALELVAKQFGVPDWNVLAAKIAHADNDGPRFERTAPILRIFDEQRAREFYLDFLGFTLDWEHRFGENLPLYAQVSRAGLTLHLSGHHGDASPGSTVFVTMRGVADYQRELVAKNYRHMRPGVETVPWGRVMEVIDPFSNRIRFCEPSQAER
ncbi:glyoxalase superfamily protein [Rhodoligotrophos ferricapiens]|uniref:glyoxalase superfamily protein n=1 Tax=Rhodoligotrophos ferricapiens TaxID=3069264 RepID=UPI00315D7916